MAASYPGAIKNFLVLEDGVDKVIAAHPNDRAAEITAIETELGTDVAGSAVDLKTRLAVSINADGTSKIIFGSWDAASYSKNTVYQAATDGIVCATVVYSGSGGIIHGLTDASNPPTTIRSIFEMAGGVNNNNIIFPVKKGQYWKVYESSGSFTITINWMPLGI